MVVEDGYDRRDIRTAAEAPVILLDTHAVIWMTQAHRRVRLLHRFPRIYLSPVSVLEIEFLIEAGRLRLSKGHSLVTLVNDQRWRLDEPPAAKWFGGACELSWTRDPFDRLLAAHARLRGWKLATADTMLLERLSPSDVVPL
jgi:PIN domain nuclease of toxin-antitoxin system